MKASRIDQGTVTVRQTGSFTIQTATTAIQSISHCKIIQKADGYAFFSHPTDSTPPEGGSESRVTLRVTRYPSSPKDEVSRARLMKKYHLALLGALCLQLTGCISYSHQQQADASAWPIPLNSAKPTVSLKVDTDYQFNGTPSQRGFNLPRLERLLIKEYQSSQAFEQVALGLNTADVYAKVKVSNHETGSMLLAILSGATLLVIPGTFDNEWIMETRFFDANGKEQGRVVKREITTTWTQLLLVFALPFNESTDEILAKLARSTLEEASQRKLL